MSRTFQGALAALAALALIHSANAATPAPQPAPAAKKTAPAPKAAPATPAARPAAPAARPATRYTPPPPPPAPVENALPMFEVSAYFGPGNFKLGDDEDSISHGSTNFGFNGWGVVSQHVLLGLDYDYSSAEFVDGVTFKIGRWRYGVGYIGPMGRTASWYVKAFGATYSFDCDSPCEGTDQSGGGAGVGFIFPFERNWLGQVDAAYTYLAEKDDDPSINVLSIGGKLTYKINRSVGLWAGISEEHLDSSDDDSYIDLLSGRFGISIDVY